MASLEGGIGAVATSSGQAAEFLARDRARRLRRPRRLERRALRRDAHPVRRDARGVLGSTSTFVPPARSTPSRPRIRPETKFLYTEIIANPSGAVADLAALADVAHDHGVPLVVDATLATPYLCRPIEHGADIVVHSATKFLGGHGTSIGGVDRRVGPFRLGQRELPGDDDTGAQLRGSPVLGELRRVCVLHEGPGRAAARRRRPRCRRSTHSSSSRDSRRCRSGWRHTLPTRARWPEHLAAHPASPGSRTPVSRSTRTTSSPRGTSRSDRAPCSVSVCTAGARRARRFIESVEMLSHLANVGDARSLVIHPASTTHQQLSDEALAARGVSPRSRAHLASVSRMSTTSSTTSTRPSRAQPMSSTETRGRWHPPTRHANATRSSARPRTVAVLGASANRARPSYFVATYLAELEHRFRGLVRQPVGRGDTRPAVYPSLAELPAPPDLVDVFRRTEDLPARRRRGDRGRRADAVAAARTCRRGRRRARAIGRADVVMNRCLKIEHARSPADSTSPASTPA